MDPGTFYKSAKYLRNKPRGAPRIIYTRTRNPATAGKKNRAKTVKFDSAMQKVNTTKSHDEPTPKENKEKNQKKNPKSDQANAYPSDYERYYVIDRLNLGEPAYDSENDSK